MKKLFILLLFLSINTFAAQPGIDYIVLNTPVKTADKSKIEVRELFWYFCPHCHHLEPSLKAWLKTIEDDVDFIQQPAVFSERWELGALYFYTLESLDLLTHLHEDLFNAIHTHKINLNTKDRFIAWLLDAASEAKLKPNLNRARIAKTMNSFAMRTKLKRSAKRTRQYNTNGVPAFIINGKYLVSPTLTGSEQRMFAVIDELLQQERAILTAKAS